MFVDVLPRRERWAYWIFEIGTLGYAIYALYVEGNKYVDNKAARHRFLRNGWGWLSRKQDVSDVDWELWKSSLWTFIPLSIMHVILSLVTRRLGLTRKIRTCLLLMFDLYIMVCYFGLLQVGILLFVALIAYASTFSGNTLIVWLVGVTTITPLNSPYIWRLKRHFDEEAHHYHLSAASAGYLCLRIISFSLEKVKCRKSRLFSNTHTKEHNSASREPPPQKMAQNAPGDGQHSQTLDREPDLLDFLLYIFYLPTFLIGPIITYSDFQQINSPTFSVDILDVFKRITRLAFWFVFIEFQSHFLYSSALHRYSLVFEEVSLWAVLGIMFVYAQIFVVKLMCLYGLNIQIARFDGIDPIPLPRCISVIYSYTDMWKYCDVGLYRFMMKCIYVPMGGSRSGILRQIAASGAAFIFIYWWHGASWGHFIWCLGNFLTGSVEHFVRKLELTSVGKKLKSYLSPAMRLRVKGAWVGLMYIISHLPTFCFLFNPKTVGIILDRAVFKGSWSSLIYGFIFFTTFVHGGLYFEARRKAKTSCE